MRNTLIQWERKEPKVEMFKNIPSERKSSSWVQSILSYGTIGTLGSHAWRSRPHAPPTVTIKMSAAHRLLPNIILIQHKSCPSVMSDDVVRHMWFYSNCVMSFCNTNLTHSFALEMKSILMDIMDNVFFLKVVNENIRNLREDFECRKHHCLISFLDRLPSIVRKHHKQNKNKTPKTAYRTANDTNQPLTYNHLQRNPFWWPQNLVNDLHFKNKAYFKLQSLVEISLHRIYGFFTISKTDTSDRNAMQLLQFKLQSWGLFNIWLCVCNVEGIQRWFSCFS